ncbi:MFS transporter [Microbacterium sp. Marseille-Q6965]|uniref:MFS transporter n=1 Tax=Microbacterium sp. Marseille-Q6965 TaxID=2965072 RepID=UPI0021B7F2C6|nr:MFS transporter [Microbacterium sp. Marseille-Q6965]
MATSESAAQRARWAVSAWFFLNGATLANLVPHFPEIKAELGLSNASYGLAISASALGSVVVGLSAGWFVQRFGSARTAAYAMVLSSAAAALAALAPTGLLFAAALFALGATDAITDVGQNAHGLRVQRRLGRSIINSFHAMWSVGAVAGGLVAAGALALDVPRAWHLGVIAVVIAVAGVLSLRLALPGADGDDLAEHHGAARADHWSRPRIVLVVAALVVIAIAGALTEDAGSTWAAVYLSTELGAATTVAAWGYIALLAAQTLGRFAGDKLIDRFGQRFVTQAGGLLIAAGLGAALLFPTIPVTIAGFALAGLGCATLIPTAMHEADAIPGLRPGTGLTIVSWLLRIGFLASPPVVGLIADASAIRTGLGIVPVAGVLVIVLALALPRRPAQG